MPNWVRNRIIIEADNYKEILAQITTKRQEEFSEESCCSIDFEKIIPMPKSLKVVSGSITNECINAYLYKNRNEEDFSNVSKFIEKAGINIKNLDDDTYKKIIERSINYDIGVEETEKKLKSEEDVINFGQQLISNIIEYGSTDWYEWSIKNWGTKWNACEGIVENNELLFETAWSPVPKIVEQLSIKFPDAIFKYDFAEEQICFICGECSFKNGLLIHDVPLPSESKEAYEKGFELWPSVRDYYKFDKKKNNYYYCTSSENDDEME